MEYTPPLYSFKTVYYLQFYGNSDIYQILGAKTTNGNNYPFAYGFKPGKYKIEVSCKLHPRLKTLTAIYEFEVVAPIENRRLEMLEYASVVKSILESCDSNSPEYSMSRTKNTLFNFLVKYPESAYAQEVFRILIDHGNMLQCIYRINQDTNLVYQIFEIFPTLSHAKSYSINYLFFFYYLDYLPEFVKSGLVLDLKSYIQQYLKRIEHQDPFFSEMIIKHAKNKYQIEGFVNYALEREYKNLKVK